jgi:nucleotide-binding universal stress UspA family protein
VAFVAALAVPPGGEATLIRVVEPVRLATAGLLPARARALVTREAASLERQHVATARRQLEAARARLAGAGWRVNTEVRMGRPLEELLSMSTSADVLVLGAQGVGAIEQLLLGSVAGGAVARAPIPVLVVR